MLAPTHVIFGLSCWTAYAHWQGLPFQPVSYAIAGFASLLPDIDHPKSTFGRCVPFLSYPISAILGHRGITHSLVAVVGCIFALAYYGFNVEGGLVVPLVIGYLSHILGDLVTPQGVPLFWPYKIKIALPLFSTGGFIEFAVRISLLTWIGWMLWQGVIH